MRAGRETKERVATEPRPVWVPLNYLLIGALERYHHFYGDAFTIGFPRGGGRRLNLAQIVEERSRRLVTLFLPNGGGRRSALGLEARFVDDPHWQELMWFHEYFHRTRDKAWAQTTRRAGRRW